MTQRDQSNLSIDPEIQGMRSITEILEPFDGKTRRRMLEWVVGYQAELPGYCLPSMRGPEDSGDMYDRLAANKPPLGGTDDAIE